MNIENFINEFKNYCETVDDTIGLQEIKDRLFDRTLNLETFMDDYIGINISIADNKDIVNEANRLSDCLIELSNQASVIDDTNIREIWKLINELSIYEIKDFFECLCETFYMMLLNSLYPDNGHFGMNIPYDKMPKWYIDLWDILDKYNIV